VKYDEFSTTEQFITIGTEGLGEVKKVNLTITNSAPLMAPQPSHNLLQISASPPLLTPSSITPPQSTSTLPPQPLLTFLPSAPSQNSQTILNTGLHITTLQTNSDLQQINAIIVQPTNKVSLPSSNNVKEETKEKKMESEDTKMNLNEIIGNKDKKQSTEGDEKGLEEEEDEDDSSDEDENGLQEGDKEGKKQEENEDQKEKKQEGKQTPNKGKKKRRGPTTFITERRKRRERDQKRRERGKKASSYNSSL